ncbi:MAG: hypothetical protein HQL51_13275, partial [Magnetococcales bacterium]|nr:hypothetical protein [Magnetococcales bacterium]
MEIEPQPLLRRTPARPLFLTLALSLAVHVSLIFIRVTPPNVTPLPPQSITVNLVHLPSKPMIKTPERAEAIAVGNQAAGALLQPSPTPSAPRETPP